MTTDRAYVIVGASLAGAKAAEALRDEGYDGPLVLVGREDVLPYERPPLSKDYLQGNADRESFVVHPAEWYAEHDVDLRLGTTVTALDPAAHRLTTDSAGRTGQLEYDKLLLATGSSPRRLPIPGAELDNVLTLRTVGDSERIRATIADASRIAILGGGWIGLEIAAAARLADVEVTVLEMLELPLLPALGPEMAQVFADLHREHGVDLRTGVRVEEILGANGRATGVRLADGARVEADAVIVGIGATPNVELAAQAGLDVDNGVLTDASLRSSNPDIFAAGDIANALHPLLGRRIRVEHWANALNQPATAAAAMLGKDASYDRLPYFFTDQYDLGMEYAGHTTPGGYDRVVVRGDLGARAFVAFWTAQGRVLAGMHVNVWDVIDDVQALIRAGRPIDLAGLGDPDVPLASLL